ncbi:hypothetical protein [Xenorhabdus entomophaga]|uniref:hypothetical protein n=1 Tax=Xenorhabdus entomophaga TaxID=3136257 RepID=UPI0030F45700
MRCIQRREDRLGVWLKKIISRSGKIKATVALANKLTRIIWRLLAEPAKFNMNKAFALN